MEYNFMNFLFTSHVKSNKASLAPVWEAFFVPSPLYDQLDVYGRYVCTL